MRFEEKSVDSTMGFTALDGLCMGMRPGALDPGVVLTSFEVFGCPLRKWTATKKL